MNYDKYEQDGCFEDFDAVTFLMDRYAFTNNEGKSYFRLNRNQAHMLLRAHKFTLTERKKKSISFLIKDYEKNGTMTTPPKKPIIIDVTNKVIIDGVTRLFFLMFQRKTQLLHVEFKL